MPYIQKNNPNPVTSCGRRRTFTQGGMPGEDRTKESPFESAGRRKSFCARSKGWKGERGRAARRRWRC